MSPLEIFGSPQRAGGGGAGAYVFATPKVTAFDVSGDAKPFVWTGVTPDVSTGEGIDISGPDLVLAPGAYVVSYSGDISVWAATSTDIDIAAYSEDFSLTYSEIAVNPANQPRIGGAFCIAVEADATVPIYISGLGTGTHDQSLTFTILRVA